MYWHGSYLSNPFPEDLSERLHNLNNVVSDINKLVRGIKTNLKGLIAIQDKNPDIDLSDEILALEAAVSDANQELANSGVQRRLVEFAKKLEDIRDVYTTHEAIRRQRFQAYVMKACYPPWDIIYDKAASLGGEIHVIGDEISSFIIPPRYRQEFLDFIESLDDYQFQGIAPKRDDSYLIRYKPRFSRFH